MKRITYMWLECPYCGETDIDIFAHFCPNCGASLKGVKLKRKEITKENGKGNSKELRR